MRDEKIKIAVIIKHPGRDNDYRVDFIDVDDSWSGAEVKEQIEREMLGPFEVLAMTTKINLNRKFPYLPRKAQEVQERDATELDSNSTVGSQTELPDKRQSPDK